MIGTPGIWGRGLLIQGSALSAAVLAAPGRGSGMQPESEAASDGGTVVGWLHVWE